MKCAQCRPLLSALAGGDLGKTQAEQCRLHLHSCASCTQQLDGLKQTLSLLRLAGQSEPLPADFSASLHRRLAAAPPPTLPLTSRLWAWLEHLGLDSGRRLALMGASAATVAVVLLLALPTRSLAPDRRSGGADTEIAASFRVPQKRIAVVHLDFVSDESIDDVEFEVTLPSELHFIDGGHALAQRTLSWRGSLSTGSNPIPLAVRGSKPGRYRVTAQARGLGLAVRHDILLEVEPS